MNRVGTGSVCQAGLQSVWGTPVTPDTLAYLQRIHIPLRVPHDLRNTEEARPQQQALIFRFSLGFPHTPY